MEWCEATQADTTTLLALGIISTVDRRYMRDASRPTWLSRLPRDVRVNFVLRGLGLTSDMRRAALEEATVSRDVLFVTASATLNRAAGPLHSTFLWLRCAIHRYPGAPFIGKAEDDVWVHA